MQTQTSPAYLAFREVMNNFVSTERIRQVARSSEKFLCFSDPNADRPMTAAVRMAARATQNQLSEVEFDAAVRQAEARLAVVPTVQLQLTF